MKMLAVVVILGLAAGALAQATITTEPSNTTAIVGDTAEFYCGVTGTQDGGTILSWRRVETNFFIGSDSTPSNTTKYDITDKYRLYIQNVTMDDEGEYQCQLSLQVFTAFLVVSDPPATMTLTWEHSTQELDQTGNLTCVTGSSKPAAELRWFRGNTELTTGFYTTTTNGMNDYGTAMSTMELTLTEALDGETYTCQADVPGGTNVLAESFTIDAESAASVSQATLSVLVLTFLAALFH